MPTREEAKQILDDRFAHRGALKMYTDVVFSKELGISGPFFQNPSKYDHSLSRPDHRGALRVPKGGFVEGEYFARFPFLKKVDSLPVGATLSFAQTLWEKVKVPVAAAKPLPKPEKPILGVSGMAPEVVAEEVLVEEVGSDQQSAPEVVAEEAPVEEVGSDQQSAPEEVKEGRKSKKKK